MRSKLFARAPASVARMQAMSAATLLGLLDALLLLAILGVASWQFAKRPDAQPQQRSFFLKKSAIIIAGAFLGLFIPWSLARLGLYLDPVTPGRSGPSIAIIPLLLMYPTYILAIFLAGKYVRARYDRDARKPRPAGIERMPTESNQD